ncbi:hypothetical protein ACHAQJ_003800 [Trichoderma viride]
MPDEPKESYSYAMKSYIKDDETDFTYQIMRISNGDDGPAEDTNVGTANSKVVQNETTTAAADNSPISDTGSWEVVNRGDAK